MGCPFRSRWMWVVLSMPNASPKPHSPFTAKTEHPRPNSLWLASVTRWEALSLFCFQHINFYSCLPFKADGIMFFANSDDGKSPFFFLNFIYLFMRDTQRGRDIGRGRSRLPSGSLMWDWIPGPRDHDLSQRQMLNHWATQMPCIPRNFFCYYYKWEVLLKYIL